MLISWADPDNAGPASYTTLENTALSVSAADGLLSATANTTVPAGATPSASGPSTTTQGGTLTVNSDGSFSYTPPAGRRSPGKQD